MTRIEGGLRRTCATSALCLGPGPLVSVITVVLNGIASIDRTIESVLRQTYPNVEYIVIDGGSTDGTIDVLRSYDRAIDYWCSEPDRGIYDAWNKGIALSKGNWIGFLGADDVYRRDGIERMVRKIEMSRDPMLEYVSGRVEFVLPGNGARRIIGSPWSWKRFRKYMNVAHVGSLHHRSLFERYGVFDTSYRICGDYELLLRARGRLRTDFADAVIATMYGGGISNTSLAVFEESRQAKRRAGQRSALAAFVEKYVAIGKFLGRHAWYRARSRLRGNPRSDERH